MHHDGRCVGGAALAPAAEPAPTPVGKLHFGEPIDARFDDLVEFVLVEDGTGVKAFPALASLEVVAGLLGVQIRAFRLDACQIDVHLA